MQMSQSTNGNLRSTTGKDRYLQLDTAPTGVPTASPGTFSWNSVDGCVDIQYLNNSTLQVGQETYFYAKADGAISNGDLCMFAGVEGDHIKAKKIGVSDIATVQANPHYVMGVATQNISNGSFGYITWFGKINGVYTKTPANQDTVDWALGDILYFSNTAGQLTKTAPTAPGTRIIVAAVIKESTGSAENGVIFVRPSYGGKLVDLDDVDGIPLTATGQMLVWDDTHKYFAATQTTTTSVRATGTADDSHLPTEKAVRDALTSSGSGYVLKSGDTMTGNLSFSNTNLGTKFGTNDELFVSYDGSQAVINAGGYSASDVRLKCGSAKTMVLDTLVYDDLRVDLSNLKAPAADPPTWVAYRSCEVPTFSAAATNVVYFRVQLPHTYAQGSDILFHLHAVYPNTNSGNSLWQLTYSWANVNAAFPTITTVTKTFASSGVADKHVIHDFGAITGTGKTVSSILLCSLSRLGADATDTYASAIYGISADFHYPIDTLGSRQEYIK